MNPSRRSWTVRHIVLTLLALVWMFPLIMVVGLSLMPASNPTTAFFGLFPQEPSFSNYVLIWSQNDILGHLRNSLLIAVPSVVLVMFLGSLTAFALARLKVPVKPLFFGMLIIAMILPMASIVVSTFQILQTIGLYDNLLGLVLVYTALGLPFATIVTRTAFLAVPRETYEAAVVDGANAWQIYWRIYLPLGKSALAVVVVWQSMMAWNDFLLPLVSLANNALKPLPLVPLAYRGLYLSQPGALFAVLVLISVPIILVYIAVQKHLVNGLAGAIK